MNQIGLTSNFNLQINEEGMENKYQITTFADQADNWEYTVTSMPDETFGTADMSDARLENFFSRPIKIKSYTWPITTAFQEKFNPWTDFFTNPRVINRITNFNLLRAKLKVRFVLNGNGFYYGRLMASYLPLHNLDEFTKNRTFVSQDLVGASQRPHVYLDPTNSQGGTLTLPFCWYENALSIPDESWSEMGEVFLQQLTDLKHANGATDPVTVSVFVWAEDVNLSIPTANEPGVLSPQMGTRDEYGTGPISKPANAIAKAAGALEHIPVIGNFAKATQIAAGATANVASIFGYSRPISLADVEPYKPTYMGNMTNVNVPDTSTKLTLDAKQELSIDPRTFGLGSDDEMTIKSIACRESYLTSFLWRISDTPEDLLWNSEVSPALWSEIGSGATKEIHMPACCFAVLPFKYWRGNMKFRFQIVASQFHKGRLKITYDPSYPLTNEYNTNYTRIVDIANERDFTLEVGWGQTRPMIEYREPGVSSPPYRDTPIGGSPGLKGNGIISLYTVNDLTSPNSTINNDITINVFVSAGDNFDVFEPTSEYMSNVTWFEPQMGTRVFTPQMGTAEHADADHTEAENAPMKPEATELMASSTSPTDHTHDVFFGDPITSFRQCLKRYDLVAKWPIVQSPGEATAGGRTSIGKYESLPDFPLYRGYAPDAVHDSNVPVANTPYNYVFTVLMNYLTPAYVCRRGGLRHKYMRTGGSTDDLWYAVRKPFNNVLKPVPGFTYVLATTSSASSQARQVLVDLPNLFDGGHATHVTNNPVLEVELPFYQNVRFAAAKNAGTRTARILDSEYHELAGTWSYPGSLVEGAGIWDFVSTGEDFQLSFFTGCPVAYRVAKGNDPTPM